MMSYLPAGRRAPSDPILLARLRCRDPDAMEQVMRVHRGTLFVVVERIVGDRWAAEDIVQDVFLRLFTHACTLHSDSSLAAWLKRVARNLALTYVRDHRRSISARFGEPSTPPAPDQRLDQREQLQRVLDAVERLDEPFRTTFRICVFDGCDYDTAARVLGCKKTTVNTRMFRSWRRLRTMLRSA